MPGSATRSSTCTGPLMCRPGDRRGVTLVDTASLASPSSSDRCPQVEGVRLPPSRPVHRVSVGSRRHPIGVEEHLELDRPGRLAGLRSSSPSTPERTACSSGGGAPSVRVVAVIDPGQGVPSRCRSNVTSPPFEGSETDHQSPLLTLHWVCAVTTPVRMDVDPPGAVSPSRHQTTSAVRTSPVSVSMRCSTPAMDIDAQCLRVGAQQPLCRRRVDDRPAFGKYPTPGPAHRP